MEKIGNLKSVIHSMIPDLVIKYKALNTEQVQMFMGVLMLNDDTKIKEFILQDSISQIIQRRIDIYKDKLEIPEIDPKVIAIISIMSEGNPGRAIAMLIELCYDFNSEVKIYTDDITKIYPQGFYDEATFRVIVDEILKPHKLPYTIMY